MKRKVTDKIELSREYSKALLATGQGDEKSSGIYVTALRASTKPDRNWRSSLRGANRGGKSEKGHARVWLLGDAVHAMQPNRYAHFSSLCRKDPSNLSAPPVWVTQRVKRFVNHYLLPKSGMGGNQAMHDCADILPYLLELNDVALRGTTPTTEEISMACDKYETAMIERAFNWVRKSGGVSMPVSVG